MDRTEHVQTLSQITKSEFLKKLTQLLLSVSVFSLLFAHSPVLSLLHSLTFHFSTFPIQLFSHTLDKNCIFFLCNGLVVFLAKFSGLINSSSSKNNQSTDQTFKHYENDTTSFTLETRAPLVEGESLKPVLEDVDVNEGQEIEKLVVEEKRVLYKKERETDFFVAEDEEEEHESGLFNEEEGNGLLTTEELNKKFDDFIRKMKKELKIEAQS
ncbi:hypothetical protein CFOL_v3_12304 [Cephalotus follicularis]|uniref:Uncharacterized protein n=1 Tax=Cephalotus follicularis TaxID=3775 RepID=A0A1Q3BLB8_CEPFO|nr:hypothetical protein CFOL_v3_12304 [Cephalotus follicularis]